MSISYGYCHCGCGEKTTISPKSYYKTGHIKGEPFRFIAGHQNRNRILRPKNGRIKRDGYVYIYDPYHPNTTKQGYILEHILIVENNFNRILSRKETIHHIDKKRDNNKIGNLMVFKTTAMHSAYHARLNSLEACGHYHWRQCSCCHKYDDPKNLWISPNGKSARHRKCHNENMKKYKKERKILCHGL